MTEKLLIEVEIQPFLIPSFVRGKEPDRSCEEGFADIPMYPLSSLEPETLAELCRRFTDEVFKKAGKVPPPVQAVLCDKCGRSGVNRFVISDERIEEIRRLVMGDINQQRHASAQQSRIRELESKYNELLMAVQTKHPEETRHQTALRYIEQQEAACHGPSQAKEQQR